jgi:formylglycine-generating enzyme required for sulfatase activity
LRQEREEVEERKRQVEQERLRKQKEEEERAKKEREVQEQQRREDEERKIKKAQERLQKQKAEEERARVQRLQMQESARGEGERKEGGHAARRRLMFLAFVVIGVLVVGYWIMNPGSDNIDAAVEPSSSDIAGVEATAAQTPQTVINSIGMEFVLIPAGEFDMGSPSSEKDRYSNEGPVHHVTISKGFYLSKYEVTQKQWCEVMGSNPSHFEGDNRPVETVSWNDIQEFIKKLNEMEGTNKYRLPSEAEWEYAARAGTTTSYSFGNDDSDLGDYAWYESNSGSKTHPVGQKQPNPWGLYDMHGNVWEWVQDRYHSSYDGAPTDGSAWESGSSSYHVRRGGSWGGSAKYFRSALRYYYAPVPVPSYRSGGGFRLLQVV